ncbi:MAG: ribosome maturation factor RimP [Legionellaceae bacterium]|nr:ribosome maturation factor RimP [Legionellaceae bacterium]
MHQNIEALIKPSVEELGCILWACEYVSQGRTALLRIFIDKPEGIGIEDCERVSRQVSSLLEVELQTERQYTLEVSSPGIPRPLFYPAHYQQFLGQPAWIKLYQPWQKKRQVEGVIEAVDETTLQLKVGEESIPFLFSNIVKGHLTGE